MSKKELRQLIRQRKRQFTQQELGELSLAVVGRLSAHKRMAEAQTVMLYCSLPDEVDTHGLIDTLYGEGKTVVLPVVTGEGEMELRVYHAPTVCVVAPSTYSNPWASALPTTKASTWLSFPAWPSTTVAIGLGAARVTTTASWSISLTVIR